MYEYISIEVNQFAHPAKKQEAMNHCMKIIQEHAKAGWRFVQIIDIRINKMGGLINAMVYNIILEKQGKQIEL